MTPFDFLNAINHTKEDLFKDPQASKDYNAFIVNRGLSYFVDTVFFANEMNRYSFIDKDQQFNFLLNICSKKKRFSKWVKKSVEDKDIDAICSYFGYSKRLANTVLNTLNDNQLQMIRDKFEKGGK
jgi:GTP-dependent phosphoenolpyruvate carboxykinase